MFLARSLLHKFKTRDPLIREWFLDAAKADDIDSPGISGDKLQVVITCGEHRETVKWSDDSLILIIEELAATEIAWALCNFHSADFSLDDSLRDFVQLHLGLRLEEVPFCYSEDGLTTMCSYDECEGDVRESEQLVYDIGGGAISILIPWDSDDLQAFLVERLRRISA